MRKIMVWLFIILYYSIFVRYEMLANKTTVSTLQLLALTIIITLATFGVLYLFACHIKAVDMLKKKKASVFKVVLMGILALGPLTFYEVFDLIGQDGWLNTLMALLVIFFLFMGRNFFTAITDFLPLRTQDMSMFTCYPPRWRSDIYPLDAIIILILAMPFIGKMIHT